MKPSTLRSYIRSLRIQNQMTQSHLTEKLNVTDKAVSKWERDLSYPDIALFPKLADILGVNVNDLLSESVDDGQPSRLIQIFEMSHDFLTPLRIILGCADMAENHYDDKELALKYMRIIKASGEYLLKKVNYAMRTANQYPDSGGDTAVKDESGELADHLSVANEDGRTFFENYDFTGKRTLVAEDVEIDRKIAAEILRQSGAEIEFAKDGLICLDKVIAAPAGYYDLILMDISMPNMDGLEATRRIRQLPDQQNASIPIIAVSANIYEKDRKAALDVGMDAFTEKPIFVEKLFVTMRQHLQELA